MILRIFTQARNFIILFIAIFVIVLLIVEPSLNMTFNATPKVYQLVVLSNSTILRDRDQLLIKILGKGDLSNLKVLIKPDQLFTIKNITNLGDMLEVEAFMSNSLGLNGLFEGYIYVLNGDQILMKKPFYFIIGKEYPSLESEGLLIKIGEDFTITIWHWFIELPPVSSSKIFIAPRLEEFKLLKEYLELELYIGMIMSRSGSWWPLRGVGTYVIDKNLDDVISVNYNDNVMLVNITLIPSTAKGVTIAYTGKIKPTLTPRGCILELHMGFNNKPFIYLIIPEKYSIATLRVSGEDMRIDNCVYNPPGARCYLVKYEKALLSTYDVKITLS